MRSNNIAANDNTRKLCGSDKEDIQRIRSYNKPDVIIIKDDFREIDEYLGIHKNEIDKDKPTSMHYDRISNNYQMYLK